MLGSLGVPHFSEASNALLIAVAHARGRLAVITDFGVQVGYLMGLDERNIVLYGRYKREDRVYWTPMVLPRSLQIISEEHFLHQEDAELAEGYLTAAEVFLGAVDEHCAAKTSGSGNEKETP